MTGVMDLPPFAPAADQAAGSNAEADAPAAAAAGSAAAGSNAGGDSAAAAAGGSGEGVKRVSFDFRQAGQWKQYWTTLQVRQLAQGGQAGCTCRLVKEAVLKMVPGMAKSQWDRGVCCLWVVVFML